MFLIECVTFVQLDLSYNISNYIKLLLNGYLFFSYFGLKHRMATSDEYVIRYHHGGTPIKGEVSYINGSVAEFAVDPDKICHWDILGDIKELGYDIEKSVNLFFIDGEGILKHISDDEGIVCLANQLRKQWVVNVYVEALGVDNDMNMP